MADTQNTAQSLMDAIDRNVARFWSYKISPEQFNRNANRLWALVERLNMVEGVQGIMSRRFWNGRKSTV